MKESHLTTIDIQVPEVLRVAGTDSYTHTVEIPVDSTQMPNDLRVPAADLHTFPFDLQAAMDSLATRNGDTDRDVSQDSIISSDHAADAPAATDEPLTLLSRSGEKYRVTGTVSDKDNDVEVFEGEKTLKLKALQTDLRNLRNDLASMTAVMRGQHSFRGRKDKEYDTRFEKKSAQYNELLGQIVAGYAAKYSDEIQMTAGELSQFEKSIINEEKHKLNEAEKVFSRGDQTEIAKLYNLEVEVIAPEKRIDKMYVAAKEKNDALGERWAKQNKWTKRGVAFGAGAVSLALLPVVAGAGTAVAAGGALTGATVKGARKGYTYKLDKAAKVHNRSEAITDRQLGATADSDVRSTNNQTEQLSLTDSLRETIETDRSKNRKQVYWIIGATAAGAAFGKYFGKGIEWLGARIGDAAEWSADQAQDIMHNLPAIGEVMEDVDEKIDDVLNINDTEIKSDGDTDGKPAPTDTGEIPTPTEIDEMQEQINELDEKVDSLAEENEALEDQLEDTEGQINSLEENVDALQAENDALEVENDALQAEIDALEAENAALEAELDELTVDDGIDVDPVDPEPEVETPDTEPPVDTEGEAPADPEVAPEPETSQLLVENGEGFQKALKDQYSLTDDQSWRAYLAIKPHLAEQSGVYGYNGDFRISAPGELQLNPQASAALQGFLNSLSDEEELLQVTE